MVVGAVDQVAAKALLLAHLGEGDLLRAVGHADIIPPIAPGVKPLHLGLAPPRGAMGPLRRRVALRQRLTFFAR